MARRMSLAVKLPLLMSAVLAIVLTLSLVATIATLRRNARLAASERLTSAVDEIVAVGTTNLAMLGGRYRAVGNDTAVRRALRAAANGARGRGVNTPTVRAALASLALPSDSGMPVELWTADGVRVAWYGNDIRPAIQLETGRSELPPEISTSGASGQEGDSLRFTSLYSRAGRVHFWYVSPVKDGANIIGYIAHQGRLAAGPQTQRTLRMLSGDSVSLYYRNIDARFWAGGGGEPAVPIVQHVDSLEHTAELANGERVLYYERRFANTPVVVGMYLPLRSLVVRAERNVRAVILLSALLLVIGTVAAWAMGRGLARPLAELTDAAGALAAGDFNARVPDGNDREVTRLAESFRYMAEQLGASRTALERRSAEAQAANRAKSEFLTTMSHELRTPLNAIGGYVDLIDMGLRGPVTAEQRRDLTRIKAAQEHLLGLISGVLDLSRIEAGRVAYDVTAIPVDAFLRSMDALVAPQAAAKNITLEQVPFARDVGVVGDREKLRQVLLNLISNAIKHTPPGGRVTLSAETRGARVAILVDDTGSGIPPDRRDVIFEPFVQLDRSLTQTREGLGLGLAISRDLARGMSGDLVVEERGGGGSRFALLLQRSTSAGNAEDLNTGELPAVSA